MLSASNLATKWAVHIHCHKTQQWFTSHLMIILPVLKHSLKRFFKKWAHNIAESELQRVMYSVQDAEQGVYLIVLDSNSWEINIPV